MKIGLDCDGVLADFAGFCVRECNRKHGTRYRIGDWTTWEPRAIGLYDLSAMVRECAGRVETWADLEAYPGVSEGVAGLLRQHDVVVVTATPPHGQIARRIWLEALGLRDVYFADGPSKVEIAKSLGLEVFVDDKPSTAELMAWAGICSFLMARPWNHPMPDVHRVTWHELMKALEVSRADSSAS